VHSETDASLASSWDCRHWAHSRTSDRRRRTPDGRACCDDVVVRRDGGGWKVEVADDWQCPMWGGSSSRGTGEPCLGDTGELSLRAYGGFAAEHWASAAQSGADVSSLVELPSINHMEWLALISINRNYVVWQVCGNMIGYWAAVMMNM